MTTPGRVGRAIIEITADYDKFAREAETKINAALRRVGANIDSNPFGTKINAIGGNVGDAFEKGFQQAVNTAFRREAVNIANTIANSIDNNASRSRLRRSFDRLAGFVVQGLQTFFVDAGEAGKFTGLLQKGFEGLGKAFDEVGGGLSTFLINAGLAVIIVPHLAGVIVTLIGNLTSLLGLLNALPGIAAVAVAAILPLIVAFQGFGDAVSAILSGDTEKINKALGKLSPSARSVAREFQALLPSLREIKKATQEAFFAPLKGTLTDVLTKIGTGTIATGFANVAAAWGRFVDNLIRATTAPGVQRLAGILFGSEANPGAVSRIIDSLSGPFSRLLDGLSNAAASTMPTIEKIFANIGAWVDRIATWLNEQAANGNFDAFLKSALQTAGDLYDLAKALLDLFLSIFRGTDEGGERFLQKVTKAVQDLTEFFESPDGQRALQALVDLANNFADALGLAVGALEKVLNLLGQLNQLTGAHTTGDALSKAAASAAAAAKIGFGAHAEGGVFTQPSFGLVAEAGPEAIIPLSDPKRASEVMGQAGLLPLAANMLAGAGLNVTVYLGTRQITEILDSRVTRGLQAAAGAITRGGRQG